MTRIGSTGWSGPEQRGRTWHTVLDDLEGEVLEAEETLARDRAEEIATWGRRATDWVPPSGVLSSAKGADAVKGRLLADEVSRRMAEAITTGFTRP